MKISLKIIAAFLLLFNGTAAIYGGLNLIIKPDGSGMRLSIDLIKNSPFTNYLIPGILLLVFNGIFSIFTLIRITLNQKNYPFFVMLQGLILTCWIIIQMCMVSEISLMHFISGFTGIALILCGWKIEKIENLDKITTAQVINPVADLP